MKAHKSLNAGNSERLEANHVPNLALWIRSSPRGPQEGEEMSPERKWMSVRDGDAHDKLWEWANIHEIASLDRLIQTAAALLQGDDYAGAVSRAAELIKVCESVQSRKRFNIAKDAEDVARVQALGLFPDERPPDGELSSVPFSKAICFITGKSRPDRALKPFRRFCELKHPTKSAVEISNGINLFRKQGIHPFKVLWIRDEFLSNERKVFGATDKAHCSGTSGRKNVKSKRKGVRGGASTAKKRVSIAT